MRSEPKAFESAKASPGQSWRKRCKYGLGGEEETGCVISMSINCSTGHGCPAMGWNGILDWCFLPQSN